MTKWTSSNARPGWFPQQLVVLSSPIHASRISLPSASLLPALFRRHPGESELSLGCSESASSRVVMVTRRSDGARVTNGGGPRATRRCQGVVARGTVDRDASLISDWFRAELGEQGRTRD
jgi:hypothetical protein